MGVRAIVLAAGKGTRMRSEQPKVLFTVAGRPLVSWVVDAVAGADPDEVVVVVGHEGDRVAAALPEWVRVVIQAEQLGTGHAVMMALEAMGDVTFDTVLVVPGDSPLLKPQSISALVEAHHSGGNDATLLTCRMADPTGYGRILRDGDRVVGIVEQRDADDEQRAIDEVGVSVYAFRGEALAGALGVIGRENAQSEYYLTDVVGALADGGSVGAVTGADPEEVQGVNSHDQLGAAAAAVRRRINAELLAAGVWMLDPERVYVDATVRVEAGARLYPGVHLEGSTSVGQGAEVGPDVLARDSVISQGARVWYSVLRGAEVGEDAEVGPYASLRPGTVLGAGAKAGTFVETKATTIGPGSKVPHLSYMGDATVGVDSNIGAGTITLQLRRL